MRSDQIYDFYNKENNSFQFTNYWGKQEVFNLLLLFKKYTTVNK